MKIKKYVKKLSTMLGIFVLAISSLSLAKPAEAVNYYTLQQVQTHNTASNCWTAINNKVYNLTPFISTHPGGSTAIIGLCGTNGTAAFLAQHSGNTNAINTLAGYYIGNLTITDTIAPTAPTNLGTTVISPSQINLAWTASTDNIGVAGYQVFKNDTQIATTTNTTYNNLGLTASTTYSYIVKAFDAAGNVSSNSNLASATTFATGTIDITMPTAPTNLSATTISTSQINLAWTASTDNIGVAGYKIFRNGNQIATSTIASFNNTGLTASTTYTYIVQAFDFNSNVSANSNSVIATTLSSSGDTIAPSAPRKLKAHNISYTHVNLKWKAPENKKGIKGYAIFRDGVKIATVKRNHYNDIRLNPATTYSYTVKAYDKAGNMSADSNTISVSTLARKTNDDSDDDDDYNEHRQSNKENRREDKGNSKHD